MVLETRLKSPAVTDGVEDNQWTVSLRLRGDPVGCGQYELGSNDGRPWGLLGPVYRERSLEPEISSPSW